MLFCLFSDFKTEKCVIVNTKSCQLLLNLIDLDVNGASFCAQTWQHEVVKNITLGFGLSSSATVAIKFFYHHCVKKKQKKNRSTSTSVLSCLWLKCASCESRQHDNMKISEVLVCCIH